MIKEFDKNNLQELRVAINTALKTVSDKYGIDVKIGNINYSGTEFSTKLTSSVKDKSNKKVFGFDDIIGKSFVAKGMEYKVTDIKPNNRKYPIIIQDNLGRTYKVAESYFNNITFK